MSVNDLVTLWTLLASNNLPDLDLSTRTTRIRTEVPALKNVLV